MRTARALLAVAGCVLAACGSPGHASDGAAAGSSTAAAGGPAAAGGGGGSAPASAGSSSAGMGDSGSTGTAGSSGISGPTVSEFMGLNAFIDDDPAKLAAVGNVREYHNWTWNDGNGAQGYAGYPNNKLQFSVFGGLWDFDAYYSKLDAAGVMVFPCLQGSVGYLGDALPPVPQGADPTDPASYVAHAAFMYQYAARYGSTSVDTSKLALDAGQKVASALKLLPYYEDGNEPDANWVHPDGSFLFTPEMTAAMASADYDGNQGKLGPNFGVKSADPKAKMVLAGLAGAGPQDFSSNVRSYLDGMRAWATAHRAGSFPADVINVHDYCFGPDPFGTANPKPGLSPEECKLQNVLSSVAQYRDEHLPGKELWLTEFGYDTHPQSRLRAPAIGGNSAQVVQGQWLVRSFLALMASGIDRAFLFVSRDSCTGDDSACPNNAVQFSTSGVLTQKGAEAPKVSYYFLAAFRARLAAMHYLGSMDSGSAGVAIARFYDPLRNSGAYVLWAPTSMATVRKDYALRVDAKLTGATLVTLVDQSATGKELALIPKQGTVTLDVDETPNIVLVAGKP